MLYMLYGVSKIAPQFPIFPNHWDKGGAILDIMIRHCGLEYSAKILSLIKATWNFG